MEFGDLCPSILPLCDEMGVLQYIYISMEEMTAVADYIRSKGRVAISELAAKSNQFIDLTAKDVDMHSTNAADLEADIFGEDS